ncbi:hypothetical protein D3C81_1696110 [compost metagenome]
MILGAIHCNHLHMRLDRGNRRHKPVAIEAIGVKIIRRQIGRTDDHHAFVEHHLKQPTENDRVPDVVDEQLIEAQHPHLGRQLPGQRTQRIGNPGQLE